MKFGKTYTIYIQTEAQRLLPQCPYVEFVRFKKLLKRCPHLTAAAPLASSSEDGALAATTTTIQQGVMITEFVENSEVSNFVIEASSGATESEQGVSNPSCPVCDAEFFSDLEKAVSEVMGCFTTCAKELLRLHMASGLRKYFLRFRSKIAGPGDRGTMIQAGNTLMSYGYMNALAIRKILKKYDKIHGSETGRAFKSRLQVKRVELLQSPLLIELGALGVNLMDSQIRHGLAPPSAAVEGQSTCTLDDDKQIISCALPGGLQEEFELTCSICLEVVFDPVALGCGHIFCNSCVCAAASVPVFQGATSAKRTSKCPVCRQAGVFPDAMPLKELHTLVGERFTSYFAERLPAEREQRVREAKMFWNRQTQRGLGL